MRPARFATVVAAVGALGVPLLALPAVASTGSARVALANSASPYAATHRAVGSAAAGRSIDVSVYLPTRNQAAADALVRAVSDPASAQYGHYLSPAQYAARFAPTAAQVSRVSGWLRSAGLRVVHVPSNNRYVEATGTVAAAEHAFGVTMKEYAVNGSLAMAPTGTASVPANLAGDVLAVSGLDQTATLRPTTIPPPAGFRNAPPCSASYGQAIATSEPPAYGRHQPYVPCGYAAAQLRSAYGTTPAIQAGFDGRGQTVAIVDAYASPTIKSDANTYFSRHGVIPFRPGQFAQLTPSSFTHTTLCGASGWFVEESLDVEAVHSMAPGANVLFVGGRSCFDGDLWAAVNRIVAHKLATVISNSYGDLGENLPAGDIQAAHQVFEQAAIEGIGVYFSSGDLGDNVAVSGTRSVNYPASDPLVTAVGGTSLAVGASNTYLFETGWGTGRSLISNGTWSPAPPGAFMYGSGGGTSRVFTEPWYQRGVVPASITGVYGGDGRAVPDIALDADPNTGMFIGLTQTFPNGVHYGEMRIGGTSLSCPLLAGIMAIADQMGGRPHGFANPAIYALSGSNGVRDITKPATPKALVRVDYANGVNASQGTVVSLRSLGHDSSLAVRPGYDTVTGVGSPNGLNFLEKLGYRK